MCTCFLDLLAITSNKAIKIFKRFYTTIRVQTRQIFNSHFLVLKLNPTQIDSEITKYRWIKKRWISNEQLKRVPSEQFIINWFGCFVCLFVFCVRAIIFVFCFKLFCMFFLLLVGLRPPVLRRRCLAEPQKRLFVVIGVCHPFRISCRASSTKHNRIEIFEQNQNEPGEQSTPKIKQRKNFSPK